jgi:hypothetical protein
MFYMTVVAGVAAYLIHNYLYITSYKQLIFGVTFVVIIFFMPQK